ncbi:MAG: hypothetical protein EOO68_03885 [Moraxellaceae bacterium]|nr:MAG: hypothetical protein EOO68_03885 [Moraxellaceae bacterium]
MSPRLNLAVLIPLCLAGLLSACAHTPEYRSSCASESDKAWEELSIAKAKGFSGTVSYTKALSLLTAAKTLQTVENHDACYRDAKKAREYIRYSYKGE